MTGTPIALRGKVALVTGSARRVGRQIALKLAACGMHVVVHYGDPSSAAEAESAAAEIAAHGVQAHVMRADLSDPQQIAALFDGLQARFGRLDLLVNNAAIFPRQRLMDASLTDWQNALAINLTAPFLCSQRAARLMLAQESGGAIINIADLSAFRNWRDYPCHGVTKAALVKLTEAFALELGSKVRVNAIAPGPVLRDESNTPEMWQRIGERLPIGTTGHPNDVAEAVVFLASQSFITGVTLRVDGGEYLL
ncbi:MAG: SDR family oxidoreductase [Chloroflexi bacterium]|nr:SDR family oxidoreductase [Chloroflexota bacterium]